MKALSLAVVATLAAAATGALAGGFAIGTQSGSGTGNAFAGGAAVAEDASVAWYNPAGMMALPSGKHFAIAGHFLRPSFKFSNTASSGAFAFPGSGDGGDAGDWAFVPNFYFTADIHPRWRFGIAVNGPFGLKTDYDAGWRGQLVALKSEVRSVNVNPSFGYRVNEAISVGAGVSVQKLDAELTNCASFPPPAPACTNVANLSAEDVGYGFNLGLMIQAAPATRVGFSYRSSIKFGLEGTATFSATPAANGSVKADLRVPDSASISVFHQAGPRWEWMADVTWTKWSTVQQLSVIRTSGAAAGTTLTTLPFRWDDTWRLGIGANYRTNDRTKLRFGAAYDETPTNDLTRTPRLPDQRRVWIAAGVQYRASRSGALEMGYAHEFVRDANVNVPVPGLTSCAAGCLTGRFNNRLDIISLQYSHSF